MRLRSRFAAEIHDRLTALLPQAVGTIWDAGGVVVAVEQIKFTSAGGFDGNWERRATLSGIMRAELRADEVDTLEVEPLIADLLAAPVHLAFDPETAPGDLSEKARFVLADWRDVIRDTQVASSLRFSLEATIAAHKGPVERPELLTRAGQGGDYTPVTEGAA